MYVKKYKLNYLEMVTGIGACARPSVITVQEYITFRPFRTSYETRLSTIKNYKKIEITFIFSIFF